METSPQNEKVSLFAHPSTFFIVHVLFALLATSACVYLYWISRDALAGRLAVKALVVLAASIMLPLSALVVLSFRPKRLNARLLFAYAFFGAAFLYLAVPVLGEMAQQVDSWIVGPTPMFMLFSGMVPVVFAGVARVATARWSLSPNADCMASLLCLVVPPTATFLAANVSFRFGKYFRDSKLSPLLESIACHILAVGAFLGCAIFFIGLLRLLHKLQTGVSRRLPENVRRYAGAVTFGLVLPIAGLSLNLSIPFPADFANGWAWGLAVLTGLVLLLPAREGPAGLVAYFLKFFVAPFVLYFFILFVPFLPLAILAILAVGTGFLILAPTLLFRYWTQDAYAAYCSLRASRGRGTLVVLALAAALVMPLLFVIDVEVERRDVKALLAWHTEEDFDLPPAPMPVSQRRARKIMERVNDYTFGVETPFLTAWRTWRVYDGMYMSDKLRNELNRRILGKVVKDKRDWREKSRNWFAAEIFGANTARRSANRGSPESWTSSRPIRTGQFKAEAKPVEETSGNAFVVSVTTCAERENSEFIADIELPAGAWIEGMRLKMTNGVWKAARPSERKAAEWVYNKITEQRLDPSLVTLDTPTKGTLKVFPVGKAGREVELAVRLPSLDASPYVMALNGKPVANPLYPATNECPIYTAEGAAVSVVPEAWMAARTNELVSVAAGKAERFSADDPELTRKLRRRLRQAAARLAADATGEVPSFEFVAGAKGCGALNLDCITNMVSQTAASAPTNVLSGADLAVLRREFPGLSAFGDKPLDGWFFREREDGGKVAVPYRKGDGGAVVFARLKGAVNVGGAWADGAKAWELENRAFLKPALDVRRELLEMTRKTGTLTTKSSYIVVETAAQEKGLKQKEMTALHGNKSLDFDESTANKSDAPGFLILLAFFAAVALLRHFAPAMVQKS